MIFQWLIYFSLEDLSGNIYFVNRQGRRKTEPDILTPLPTFLTRFSLPSSSSDFISCDKLLSVYSFEQMQV